MIAAIRKWLGKHVPGRPPIGRRVPREGDLRHHHHTAFDLAWYAIHHEHRDPAGDAAASRIEHTYSFDEIAAAVNDPGQALDRLAAARVRAGWDPADPGLRDT